VLVRRRPERELLGARSRRRACCRRRRRRTRNIADALLEQVSDAVRMLGDEVDGECLLADLENQTLRVRARTTYNREVCRGWNDNIGRGCYQVRSRLSRRGSRARS
jgi:hypothetical protein